MNILRNAIYRDTATEEIFRVLATYPAENIAVAISLVRKASLPYYITFCELDEGIASNLFILSKAEPLHMSEAGLSEKQKLVMEKSWNQIGDFVRNEPSCYDSKIRSDFLTATVKEYNCSRMQLQRILYRYWAGGMSKYALIPNYQLRSGAKNARTYTSTAGRPVVYNTNNKRMNICEIERKQIRHMVNSIYNKNDKYSLKFTYQQLIKSYYTDYTNGELAESYPTFAQFQYHAKSYMNEQTRVGEKKFARNNRALLGNCSKEASGPQDKYQIDATIADVYLVSQVDRSKIVGRPVLYFVTDVFSRMITGFYVGLEGPSWNTAMMALNYTFTEKVELCRHFGVEITNDDWPCYGLPKTLLVDNGELICNQSNTLIENLGIQVQNHSAWRPDLKGIVEQSFHLLNQSTKMLLPGAVLPDFGMRGSPDYRLDAKLTIKEFTKIIILYILKHNKGLMSSNPQFDEDVIRDHVLAIPIDLWNWGITHRTGALNVPNIEEIRIKLLPEENASITFRGIQFRKMLFVCKSALDGNWFVRVRAKGRVPCRVKYDPRNMDALYFCHKDGTYEYCERTEDNKSFYAGWTLEDIEYYQAQETATAMVAKENNLKHDIDFNGTIEDIIKQADEKLKIIPFDRTVRNVKPKAKDIRENHAQERDMLRATEAFIQTAGSYESKNDTFALQNSDDDTGYSDLILRMQKEDDEDE